ncbi:MAG TPA: FAD-dependent oxidoreductase [Oscillospiraceae bacterium]|nr:FAD-dependent oxidoreductase [Oscillospiraceae bacterium]
MEKADLVVIGGGPAGMAAALRAKERGVKHVTILERAGTLGGILEQCIHAGFGLHYFKEELTGPEYAARFIKLIEQSDIKVKLHTMVLDISKDNIVTLANKDDGILEIKAKAIILAMGCRERPRGALSIAGTRPTGVMTAGQAQEYINLEGYMVGKTAVILGSGDIGLIMARRMTLEGAKVKMVCELMPYSGGLMRNIVQCLDDFDIPLRFSCTVVEVHGKERLEGVTVQYVDENLVPIEGTKEYVECDTLLLSVGLIPENELSKKAGIELDKVTGGPVVDETRRTSRKGIFACGNVLQVHDLVDYVTQESSIAADGAADFILLEKSAEPEYIEPSCGNGVRYIVPQKVNIKSGKNIKLYFRVNEVFSGASIVLTIDDKEVIKRKKAKITPGEMESVTLSADMQKEMLKDSKLKLSIRT